MDTLITCIKGTDPFIKAPLVYDINSGQVDSNSIMNYNSAMGAKRYRYTTAVILLTEFEHTTRKVL